MSNVCNICNKVYKSYKSLWNHNHKYHVVNCCQSGTLCCQNVVIEQAKEFNCKFCSKKLADRHSKSKHEKICKEKINVNQNKLEIEIIKKEIENLKKKSFGNTTINNINKGVINNSTINFSMNKTGFESLEILTDKEIEYIFNQEMNSIISLIEFLNFNEAHPENHTFCTTALNDKYVSTINTETFAIEKQRKTDFYDNLINRGICNMKLLFERLQVMKTKKLSNCENKIKQLIDFLVVNKKGKKACVELINALSFNKRHITQSTWFDIIQGNNPLKTQTINDDPDKFDETNMQTKENLINSNNKSNKKLLKHYFDSDTEDNNDLLDFRSESSSGAESESEDNESIIFPKIEYKGQTYILDGTKLFTIDPLEPGKKLKLFGTFNKGKVKENKDLVV